MKMSVGSDLLSQLIKRRYVVGKFSSYIDAYNQ